MNKQSKAQHTLYRVLFDGACLFVWVFGIYFAGDWYAGRKRQNPLVRPPGALLPPLVIGSSSAGLHVMMRIRRMQVDQLILPITMLLHIGLLLVWRLEGATGAWQQLLRGFLSGMAVIGI